MFESKYSNFLTIILVIVIIAIIGLLGYLGYNLYSKYFISKDSAEFVDAFVSAETDESNPENETNTENQSEATNILDGIMEVPSSTSGTSSGGNKKKTFKISYIRRIITKIIRNCCYYALWSGIKSSRKYAYNRS